MNTLVSVIIPSFNKGRFIKDALSSVLNQSYKNIEVIIVDDHSTDSSIEFLQNFNQDERVQINMLEENKGANFCRNMGLKMCRGEYVLFFDADDILKQDCIEKRLEFIRDQSEPDFAVFKGYQFLKDPNLLHKELPADVSNDHLLASITLKNSWQTSQLFWKVSYLRKMGGFDESMKRFQDIELNTRVLFSNPQYKVSENDADVFIRISNDRLTMSHFDFCKRTVDSIVELSLMYQSQILEKYKKPYYLESLIFALEIIEMYVDNNAITGIQYEELANSILKEKRIKKWSFIDKLKHKKRVKKTIYRNEMNKKSMSKSVASKLSLFTLFIMIGFAANSQTYTIKGVVKDQTDSLVFANGLLLNKSDSSLIKGTMINNGILLFEGVAEDTALLRITSLDIESYLQIVRPEGNVLDLGTISVESGLLLDGADLTVMKSAFVVGESGEVNVNVKGTILESSTSITDVLSKSPSVIVEEGSVSVFGKGEAIILLDGKLISSAQLQTIQVSNIDHIEVLSNPPAKYDASGKAVINVILVDNPLEGFQGEVVQNTTLARFLQSYTAVALNYRKNKLSLQGSYGQDVGRNWGTNKLERETFSNLGSTYSINDFEDESNLKYFNTYNLGFTYDLDKNNSLSLEYVGSSSITDQDSEAETMFKDIDQSETRINTSNGGTSNYLIQSINLNYSRVLDTLGSNLFVGGHYFVFDSESESLVDEEIILNNTTNLFERKNESQSDISFATVQIDYQKNYKTPGKKLEIGVKGISADNSGIVDFLSRSAGADQYTYFPSLSNDFRYKEKISAMYTQFATGLGEKTNLSLGLRGELTDADGFSNALDSSIIDSTYFNIFPNMNLQYKFNGKWNANLSLSSTINRPTYQALDPFLFYVDSLTTNQGNPSLRPEYAYSIESNIRYKRYSLKIGYTLTDDAFRHALLPGNNGQSSSTLMQINVEREHSYFASVQIPFGYKKILRSFNIIGATMDQVDDSRPEFSSGGVIPRFYFFSNNMINIGKAGKLQVGLRFMSTRDDGLYNRKPFFNMDLGWTKSFLDNKLNLSFLAGDVFHTNIVDGFYELNNSKVSYLRKMNTRLYRLTIRYVFGKLKKPGFSSVNVGTETNKRIRK